MNNTKFYFATKAENLPRAQKAEFSRCLLNKISNENKTVIYSNRHFTFLFGL